MFKLPFLPRLMLLVPMLLAVQGCVGSTLVSAPPPACSSLIPDDWAAGVKHAPPPAQETDPVARLKVWIGFGVAEAGNVEIADQRTRDALGIIQRCEARDAAAVNKSRRKILGLF